MEMFVCFEFKTMKYLSQKKFMFIEIDMIKNIIAVRSAKVLWIRLHIPPLNKVIESFNLATDMSYYWLKIK